jgi:hypothetical protein
VLDHEPAQLGEESDHVSLANPGAPAGLDGPQGDAAIRSGREGEGTHLIGRLLRLPFSDEEPAGFGEQVGGAG